MRQFARYTLVSAALVFLFTWTWSPQPFPTPRVAAQTATSALPNIVFILTDDMALAEMPFMPKLQALMLQQGTYFNNFIVNVSLCCPSRANILRGQYSHNTKITDNVPPNGGFETFHANGDETSTIATWLQQAGYRTMLAGKYLNGYPNTVANTFIPPGWSEWYSPVKGWAYSEYNYSLNENGKIVDYLNRAIDYGTDVYARKTIDFIQRATKDGKPFFAYVAPFAPHQPSTPAPRHANLFPNVKAPRTPDFNEADVRDKPLYVRNRPLLNDAQIALLDDNFRLRLRSLQAVDDLIGNVIDTLKATGQLDNTYLFFASDNGYHLGNHRLDVGKVAPYEPDIRVPLIVRGPGVPVWQLRDHLAGTIDLAPTWAQLAGITSPAFVDGRSLVPLLKSDPLSIDQWRQCYLIQNGGPGASAATLPRGEALPILPDMLGLLEPADELSANRSEIALRVATADINGVPPYQGLRTPDYTYVEYATGEKELYDLHDDPYQLNNLAPRASADAMNEYSARLHALEKCSGEQCRGAENQPFTKRSNVLAVQISGASLAPTALRAGDLLFVVVQVRNDTNETIPTQGPSSGFIYNEGESFRSRGFGEVRDALRVGIDFDGRSGIDHPYRWGLSAPLAPGQSATIAGAIRLRTPRTINYWVGLVREGVAWLDDQENTQSVTVVGTNTVQIIGTTFSPTTLRAGELLTVTITVQNNTTSVVPTQGPPPGFVYDEGQSFRDRGFPEVRGAFRVGVDFDGRAGINYPYRWGLGAPLAPGQTATITGAIRLRLPRVANYWGGLVREWIVWTQEAAGKQAITVTP